MDSIFQLSIHKDALSINCHPIILKEKSGVVFRVIKQKYLICNKESEAIVYNNIYNSMYVF